MTCKCSVPSNTAHAVCNTTAIWITAEDIIGSQIYNGLCECRGPLNRHPFHSQPLPAEYVGKHRAP